MKYRVVQVFDTPLERWFRLQKSEDGDKWDLMDCGSDAQKLIEAMRRIVEHKEPVTIAEVEA
jgi:hypothetical protein